MGLGHRCGRTEPSMLVNGAMARRKGKVLSTMPMATFLKGSLSQTKQMVMAAISIKQVKVTKVSG